MKKFLVLGLLSVLLLPGFAGEAQNEIVIEMVGTPDKNIPEQNIWDKNALQLTKLLRKTNKAYVLRQVNDMANKEKILTAKDGTEYVMIQYGNESWKYRKFLFQRQEPQTFVTCAANAKDIVAIFQKYGVNMGMKKGDLLETFSPSKFPKEQIDGTRVLTVYQIEQQQLPLRAQEPVFAVVEQNRVVELFASAADFNAYQSTLQPAPPPATPKLPAKSTPAQPPEKPLKALLSGGTIHDQMYMPRVVSGPFTPPNNTKKAHSK